MLKPSMTLSEFPQHTGAPTVCPKEAFSIAWYENTMAQLGWTNLLWPFNLLVSMLKSQPTNRESSGFSIASASPIQSPAS
jgi:hypothetical protein